MQYEHIQDGLYRESVKASVTETRKQWNQRLLTYLDLIDWDLMRPEHQKNFMEHLEGYDCMLAKGIDKVGRLIIIVKATNGTYFAVQNGQYSTGVYSSKEVAEAARPAALAT